MRCVTFVLVLLLAALGQMALPESVGASRGEERVGGLPRPERLGGLDRYAGAVAASVAMGLRHVETVYVASGENFPDALSAASVAGINGAPLLLTARETLPDVVRREIARLTPATVVVVGGELAVSEVVALELSRAATGATVTRITGTDRYEVSRRLVSDPSVGAAGSPRMIAATGRQFPDALSSAPVAAKLSSPVVLVDGLEAEPTAAETALLAEMATTSVLLAGGTASISAPLETAMKRTVLTQRFSGGDRFATSVALNATFTEAKIAYLASGQSFPDALSGGPLAARFEAPLYLVRQDCVPQVVLDDLARLAPEKIVLLGGSLVLTAGVESLTPCP
ncbi:cell wall-binding repeat-containing protein [Herbiconiux sp. VKM Ac-2851]|uniref:cell wall-binding repeat-containing protein n=1 Tax=Herbiconiux sp. VKM Ac-2851 TaxID=2739025 RepID=UPI0015639C76|nr:cell wall-binding repeat-containing protein [Herbiconiux sp. VKM Ac-2851]NQX35395.1 cell wall-binding repeat-containing protein [Herbiconiux sp. VKM Ac-2851]